MSYLVWIDETAEITEAQWASLKSPLVRKARPLVFIPFRQMLLGTVSHIAMTWAMQERVRAALVKLGASDRG